MSQTILLAVIAVCALIQAIFLLNHQYLVRGTLLSAVSGLVCLVGLELLLHALGECDRGMLGAEIRGSAVHGNEAGYGADVDYLAV